VTREQFAMYAVSVRFICSSECSRLSEQIFDGMYGRICFINLAMACHRYVLAL
jgi:hypothetical protein